TVSRAQALVATGAPEASDAVRMADVFCRQARRSARALFRDLWSNDDALRYRHGVSVLDGASLWLEAGILEQRAAPVRSREQKHDVPVAV
ncbi:MAG TPA: acyl-CoA dehydrogenase, partial [Myxococcota bacterium]|nr:acyl-CoA dehydrogenase [Myxococcota bacterium]